MHTQVAHSPLRTHYPKPHTNTIGDISSRDPNFPFSLTQHMGSALHTDAGTRCVPPFMTTQQKQTIQAETGKCMHVGFFLLPAPGTLQMLWTGESMLVPHSVILGLTHPVIAAITEPLTCGEGPSRPAAPGGPLSQWT